MEKGILIFKLKGKIPRNHSVSNQGLIISHIGLHETRAIFSSTSSRIYDKEKREQVKEIIFNKFAIDSNIFLFGTVNPKIGHELRVRIHN